MLRVSEIKLPLEHTEADLLRALCRVLRVKEDALAEWTIRRRSIDARKGAPRFAYTIDARLKDEAAARRQLRSARHIAPVTETPYRFPAKAPKAGALRPVIVGAGPCGLFAGLMLAQAGHRPILIERGKPAKQRARDVARFWRLGVLDTESNVQFGEGGAGTFSDGKLATQIKDRGSRCRKVLDELVAAGAPEEILYLARPHMGTDKLIKVAGNLRRAIEARGAATRLGCRVDDLLIENGAVRAVLLGNGERIDTDAVVLAIGHSARDTFAMLRSRGVRLTPKPFSIGLRIEHPQSLINKAQYGKFARHPALGAADYKLAHRCANGRSVYSFCMCPGGRVIAAASEQGRVATNGMSAFARRGANANSGLMVGVEPGDFGGEDPLAGVAFQRRWEAAAFALGGGNFKAPAQLVADFLAGQPSRVLGAVAPSYRPGVTVGDVAGCLPEYAAQAIKEAIGIFDRKLRGFALPDALLTGVESRSSSPVRIVRGDGLQSENVKGLFPAGEGAGYAGGIISAAVDGIRTAEAVALRSTNS